MKPTYHKKAFVLVFAFFFFACYPLLCRFPWLTGFSRFPGLPGLPGLSLLPLLTTASAATTATSLAATTTALLAVTLVLAVLVVANEVGGCQSLREIDLCADSIGQVADHQNILDVVVEVVLNLGSVDLGRKRQSTHQVLTQSVVRLLLFVQNAVDPLADTVQQVQSLLDGPSETLDI